MECYNHPDKEAENTCIACGKAICPECTIEIAGNSYCKECVEEIVTQSRQGKTSEPAAESEEIVETEEPIEELIDEAVKDDEPIETITPLKPEEIEAEQQKEMGEIPASPQKAAENYQPDYEYETEYVETYDDGEEDSYYENPEIIPEPEPEYMERERILEEEAKKKAAEEKARQEELKAQEEAKKKAEEEAALEEDFYEPIPNNAPSNELEAKYEKYLDDLYYDEEEIPAESEAIVEELEEDDKPLIYKKARERNRRPRPQEMPREERRRSRRPRRDEERFVNQGEYRINPRDPNYEEGDFFDDEEFIVPAHRRGHNEETESYGDLKKRIRRNKEREEAMKEKQSKRGRLRRRKRPQPIDDFDLEDERGIDDFEEFEKEDKITLVDIILTLVLIALIILIILYVIYLFRLSGEYFSFIESLMGLASNPANYLTNVLN